MVETLFTNPGNLDFLPNGWELKTVDELCLRVTSGGTPSRRRPDFYVDGIHNWFKTKELQDAILHSSEEQITTEAIESSSAKILPKDTVLMAMYGDGKTITSLGVLSTPATCNQACCAMIVNPEVCDHRFLFYALKHHRQDFLQIASGGAQRNLSGSLIKRFGIKTPPLDEQRRIAHILGTLDDKIELNRQMNRTLDEIARTLFRSWFVDFDPVRAKMDGCQLDGMDAATAALFPDRLVDSELGRIPEGWAVKPIGEMVTVVGGSTPSTRQPEYWEGGTHHWATPKDLSGLESPILIDTARQITDVGVDRISSGLLPVGSVLLSSRAPVGYLAVTIAPTAINQGFIGMICDKGVPNSYVLYWTQSRMETIKASAGGTTFAEISKSAFRPIGGVVPDSGLFDRFSKTVDPLLGLVVANLQENQTLTTLRDTLLHKLMSADINLAPAGEEDQQDG